jgi:hypothetical protein
MRVDASEDWEIIVAKCAGCVVKYTCSAEPTKPFSNERKNKELSENSAYAEQRRVSLCMRSCSERGGSGAQGARTKCRTTVAVPCPPSFTSSMPCLPVPTRGATRLVLCACHSGEGRWPCQWVLLSVRSHHTMH